MKFDQLYLLNPHKHREHFIQRFFPCMLINILFLTFHQTKLFKSINLSYWNQKHY